MFSGVWRGYPNSGIAIAIMYGVARDERDASNTKQFSSPEVPMAGRRSHPRFAVATPWDGAMRVLRDVILHRSGPEELLAVSQTPGLIGEEMTLDVIGGGLSIGLRVKVVDSRPLMVDGAVRHRIRLELLNGSRRQDVAATESAVEMLAGGAIPAEAI